MKRDSLILTNKIFNKKERRIGKKNHSQQKYNVKSDFYQN